MPAVLILFVIVFGIFGRAAAGAAPLDRSTPAAAAAPRSEDGHLQITAAEATTPVNIDGTLDDEVWRRAVPVGGFVQSEPNSGQPATEETEVRVAYDRNNLYIAADCRDSSQSGGVINDIRKDFKPGDQDSFEVIIDTFGDRRNGYVFMTNPEGARSDQQIANEGRETNASWDAVWSVRTRRTPDGWTVEMAIPFRSLRFQPGAARAWGINFSRRIRQKNETVFWSPVPRAFTLSRVSLAGNLAGLTAVNPGHNLRLKPYVLGSAVRPAGGQAFDGVADFGLDVKYGVTPSLTLDVTARPDFAQAEADEQQVNLTQFSQFFPEKRDFFLENSGIFYVGDAARNNRINPTPTPDEDLLLFFSRRIGLAADGTVIPIAAGARLTGQAAGFGIGALTVQTRATANTPASTYTVLRGRRNLFRASDVGVIFMSRQSTDSGGDYNRVYGIDANIRMFGNLDWSSYVVKTATPGVAGDQYAVRTSFNWEGDFFHGKGGVMSIGEHFNDELGYYRRVGARKWFLDTGIRPRPLFLSRRGIREVHPHVVWSYYTDQAGSPVGKHLHNGLSFFFNNGGFTELSVNPQFQRIERPLALARGIPPVPAGSYGWEEYQWRLNTDPSRLVSANLTAIGGGLWSGTQRTVQAGLTVRPSYRLRMTAGLQRTAARLEVPAADFVTSLLTLRTNYSFSTNMFLDSLLQYNRDQDQLNANIRFNLVHRPLSDLFVVYNEQRFMTPEGVNPGRGIILKFSEMLAF